MHESLRKNGRATLGKKGARSATKKEAALHLGKKGGTTMEYGKVVTFLAQLLINFPKGVFYGNIFMHDDA